LLGILSPELAYAILFVYNVCSKVVHGEVLSKKDALMVRELGVKTLINLRKIAQEREEKRSILVSPRLIGSQFLKDILSSKFLLLAAP